MAEKVRLYAGTDHGVRVYRPGAQGWDEVASLDAGPAARTICGSDRHPERVFAGLHRDGLYRTEDAGVHWEKVFEGQVRSVAFDPSDEDVVYIGTEPIQLFRSDDRGSHWDELRSLGDFPPEIKARWWFPTEPHIGHVLDIHINPVDPNLILLALEHGGIVRSLDRGRTWEDVSAGIDYLDIHMLASLPGRLDRYYAATARGFYTTEDPADGWVRAERGFTRDYFHDFVFLPPDRDGESPTMLIATADKSPGSWNRPEGARAAVFRSFDCGGSWHQIGAGLPESLDDNVWGMALDPRDKRSAFIGLGSAFAASGSRPGAILGTRDRGESWQPLGMDVPAVRCLWAVGE
jgi:photosystem II stability/assembly factor-like uncharacterized protein